MTDTRTGLEKIAIEKKLNLKPGMLALYEQHLSFLCHKKWLESKREGK